MLFYRGLQGRIMAALAFVTLFSIIGLGLVAYWRERNALQDQLSLELTASVNYTQQRLRDWLHERQSDIRFLAGDDSNRESFIHLVAADVPVASEQLHRSRLIASLRSMQQARPEYRRILMADTQGKIIVAADPTAIGHSVAGYTAFHATLTLAPTALTQGYIEDITYDEELGTYVMCFGYPLLDQTDQRQDSLAAPVTNIGVVLITVDVQPTVYQILTEWRTGRSGAAVLSRAEGDTTRILNHVVGDEARPLQRVLSPATDPQSARPAYLAARGQEGSQLSIDHLQTEVLTVYRYIPEMKWGLVLKMNTSEVFAPLHELVRHVLYIAVGVLTVGLVVSVLIAQTLTRPLAELVTMARTVAAGETPVYTALERQDEIGSLARSLREMVDALQRQQEQLQAVNEENAQLVERLQSWNTELEQKVEARTHELAVANQRLLVLDKMKSDLLYSISHELRNPLTNLKLQLDLLHHHIDSPRRQKHLAAASHQVTMLGRLVADTLDLIQIDGMEHHFVFNLLDFNTVVADVVKSSVVLIQQANKPISLHFEPHPTPLLMQGEQKNLCLAVTHLLKNAINFTPSGEIKVTIGKVEEGIYLQIQDTGIGIAAYDLPHIFERFFRGANVSQSTIPGSGLGLSVVEKIILLHNGRLAVESSLGKGSLFRLWLPIDDAVIQPTSSITPERVNDKFTLL